VFCAREGQAHRQPNTKKRPGHHTMYLLKFSRYDCPGCDRKWFFETIKDLETFLKDVYPKFPETEWRHGHEFYPNGLSIYECVLKMRSMVETHDFAYEMSESLSPQVNTVAKLIYDLQGIVDAMEDGEYQWPLDQIIPRVDKEDLVKTVFQPDRMVRMGGPEWLECV
jgi:hypothetical protein